MKTKSICNLLGVQYPILQGGMAWISHYSLAHAVCCEGALGILTSVVDDLNVLREEIRLLKKENHIFGVNVMMQGPNVSSIAKLLAQEHVPVITVGGGNPIEYMELWHRAGSIVIPVVGNVNYAILMERMGADAIIAEGMESGGHIGQVTTFSLLPQVCEAVHVPVIAAGGIYDKKSIQAAQIMGASGVQLGTRFLLAKECIIHEHYKERLLKANDHDTIILQQGNGHNLRALKSPFTSQYQKVRDEDLQQEMLLRKQFLQGSFRLAVETGDEQHGCFLAGQIAGRMNCHQTVKEMIQELI